MASSSLVYNISGNGLKISYLRPADTQEIRSCKNVKSKFHFSRAFTGN